MVFHPTRCPQLLDWPFNLLQAVSGLRWVSFVIRDDAKKPWLPYWIHKLLGKFDSPASLALWRPSALGCSWSSWGTVLLCYYGCLQSCGDSIKTGLSGLMNLQFLLFSKWVCRILTLIFVRKLSCQSSFPKMSLDYPRKFFEICVCRSM